MRLSPEITIFTGVQIATMVVALACAQIPIATTTTNDLTPTLIGTGSSRLHMEDLPNPGFDVGPEFFQDLRNPVGRALLQQRVRVIPPIALIGRPEIRNSHSRRIAQPFRIVEPGPPGIGVSDENARERVPGPVLHAAPPRTDPEIAGILMQHRREKTLGHHVAE